MQRVAGSIAVLVLVLSTGCDSPAPTELRPGALPIHFSQGLEHRATGGGRYFLQNTFDTRFAFSAVLLEDGRANGHFHQSLELGGEKIEFHGRVTCLAFDPANNRAWIGGVITQNNSTEPSFQQNFHQPGHDVWFRVVDYGEGAGAPADRTTFLGFENTPGIPTSAFYCETKPWPDDDARTWPVTEGNIQVK